MVGGDAAGEAHGDVAERAVLGLVTVERQAAVGAVDALGGPRPAIAAEAASTFARHQRFMTSRASETIRSHISPGSTPDVLDVLAQRLLSVLSRRERLVRAMSAGADEFPVTKRLGPTEDRAMERLESRGEVVRFGCRDSCHDVAGACVDSSKGGRVLA